MSFMAFPKYESKPTSTPIDFAVSGSKRRTAGPAVRGILMPKSYQFSQGIDPEEFFLGQNLCVEDQRQKFIAQKLEADKASKPPSHRSNYNFIGSKSSASSMHPSLGYSRKHEVMPQSEYSKIPFHESRLRNFIGSGASIYDSIRPCYDMNISFFPYRPVDTTKHYVIHTSGIRVIADDLPIPQEYIEKLILYLAAARVIDGRSKIVSSIVEIDLYKGNHSWRPNIFHEHEWIILSDQESYLYFEVVAAIRVQSPNRPFVMKYGCIADGKTQLVGFHQSRFTIMSTGLLQIQMNPVYEQDSPYGEIAVIVSLEQIKINSTNRDIYEGLPQFDFVCPSKALHMFKHMRMALMKMYDPFVGNFDLWSPGIIEPLLFRHVCFNEKVLSKLAQVSAENPSEQTVRALIRKVFPCTNVLPQSSPYSLDPKADNPNRAGARVATELLEGRYIEASREKNKPFHTDELRGNLFIYPVVSYESRLKETLISSTGFPTKQ